jgi:hypothetical protein
MEQQVEWRMMEVRLAVVLEDGQKVLGQERVLEEERDAREMKTHQRSHPLRS